MRASSQGILCTGHERRTLQTRRSSMQESSPTTARPKIRWIGKKLGGFVAYGGGLALYRDHQLIGGLGVSGDTSCADHNVAWRIRESLGMGNVPDGPSPAHNDAIIYDIGADGKSASGFGQPKCHKQGAEVAQAIGSGINVSHQ